MPEFQDLKDKAKATGYTLAVYVATSAGETIVVDEVQAEAYDLVRVVGRDQGGIATVIFAHAATLQFTIKLYPPGTKIVPEPREMGFGKSVNKARETGSTEGPAGSAAHADETARNDLDRL